MRLAVYLLAFWPIGLLAQFPSPAAAPHHHSFSLDVQATSTGGVGRSAGDTTSQNARFQSYDGTTSVPVQLLHTQDQHVTSNSTHLQVNVRNMSAVPDTATVEWYFIATPVGETAKQVGTKDFVFDHGSQPVTVQPGKTDSRPISSKEASVVTDRQSTAVNSVDRSVTVNFGHSLPAVGTTKQQGMAMRGWLVRLMDGKQILAVQASGQTYEDLAKDDAKLNALLAVTAPTIPSTAK